MEVLLGARRRRRGPFSAPIRRRSALSARTRLARWEVGASIRRVHSASSAPVDVRSGRRPFGGTATAPGSVSGRTRVRSVFAEDERRARRSVLGRSPPHFGACMPETMRDARDVRTGAGRSVGQRPISSRNSRRVRRQYRGQSFGRTRRHVSASMSRCRQNSRGVSKQSLVAVHPAAHLRSGKDADAHLHSAEAPAAQTVPWTTLGRSRPQACKHVTVAPDIPHTCTDAR